jgi:hypothetical protein
MAQKRFKKMKLHLSIFAILFFFAAKVQAQLYGPTAVVVNCTTSFTYNNGSVVFPSWTISSNGAVLSTSQNGNIFSATVKWTSTGTGTLTFKDGSVVKASASIPVSSLPSEPSVTNVSRCGIGTANLSATAGATGGYVRWYTNQVGGQGYFLQGNNYTTPSLSANTSYYVTTYDLCTGAESSPRTPISVIVYTSPSAPATVTNAKAFINGTVTLSVSSVSGASNYLWYSVSTGGSPINNVNTTSYTLSITGPLTFYVAAVSGGMCEGSARTPVSALIEPNPIITSSANEIIMGANVTLDGGDGYSSYTWKNADGNIVATGRFFQTNIAGSYTVEVTKDEVGGVGTSAPYVLRGQMDAQNLNYIITNSPLKAIQNESVIDQLIVRDLSQTIQYFDDLGRPIQTVTTQGSPTGLDIIQPMAYDEYGRSVKKYLPYTGQQNGWYKFNALKSTDSQLTNDYDLYKSGDQFQFYQQGGNLASDAKPFAEAKLEMSPVNRVYMQGLVGEVWQPNVDPSVDRSIHHDYTFNQQDEVLLFKYDRATGIVDAGNNGVPRYYDVNQLHAYKSVDENKHEVIEYYDKDGHTVCRKVQSDIDEASMQTLYASTYYVYDDNGNLIVVLPPEAIKSSLDAFIK